jgi:hypothetical protein
MKFRKGLINYMEKNIANRIIGIIALISIFSIQVEAQRWKSERHAVVLDLGINHFMGDLGGGGKDAAHFFGVRDLDFSSTRPVISAKYRFRILETLAGKAGFTYAILSANDAYSGNQGRKLRNLSFTTPLYQFSLHGEYYFVKEKPNPRYSFTTLHSIKNFSAYAFTGASFLFFNPKAKLDGTKYELQSLGTEGQGIGSNPAKYKKFAVGIPIGLGAKYRFTNKIDIGIEISNTYTTTDYLDDAHDSYYDNSEISAAYGDIAAQLADRHIDIDGNDLEPYPSGKTMRGNPKFNDAYIFTVVTLTYKIKKDNTGLPKF